MKKAITLCTLLLTLIPGHLFAAQTFKILVDLTYSQPDDYRVLAGYHLYQGETKVCTTYDAAATTLECTFDSDPGNYDFTLTAHFTNGTESTPSIPYPYSLESNLTAEIITTPLNLTGEVPFSVSFDGSGSMGNIASYSWIFGDGATASGDIASHTYTKAGSYNAILTTTDNLGNTSEKIVKVTATTPPVYSDGYKLHIEWNHDFADANGKTLAGYHLYQESSKVCSTQDPTATSMDCTIQSAKGTYKFTLTAFFTDNTETAHSTPYTFALSPISEPDLVAKIKGWPSSLSGDAPLNVTFNGMESAGNIVNYDWYFGDNTSASGSKILHAYENPGVYTAILVVTSSSGAVSQESVNITVTEPNVLPKAVISPSTTTGEAPLTVTFKGSGSTNASSYIWTFGDGDTTRSINPTHIFSQAGTYTTRLTTTNKTGSDQAKVTITVTAANTANTAPTPVISTTTAVGEAPHAVTFNGSGSSDKEGSIISYEWSFGDGGSDTGISASHTYTVPGNYTATLTVKDEQNVSKSITTPVLISKPTQPNEPPTARLTSDVTTGSAPLTVNFSGKNSTDPENDSLTYTWNFGDGTTKQGVNVSHKFAAIGVFNVSLTVTDNSGASSTAATKITTEEESTAFHIELDEIKINHLWKKVVFSEPFNKPVVIAGPLGSKQLDAPSVIRLRNITSTGFEIRLQEWDYLDGYHSYEIISYLAMEQGRHTLENGAQVEAGTISTKGPSRKTVTFSSPFKELPVMISSLASFNDKRAAASRIHSIYPTKFTVGIHEEEASTHSHGEEKVGYIACEPTSFTLDNMKVTIDKTDKVVKHKWYTLNFGEKLSSPPLFLAGMSPQTGSNTATLRYKNLTNSSVDLMVQEETSKDSEIRHSRETIGYFIFSQME